MLSPSVSAHTNRRLSATFENSIFSVIVFKNGYLHTYIKPFIFPFVKRKWKKGLDLFVFHKEMEFFQNTFV